MRCYYNDLGEGKWKSRLALGFKVRAAGIDVPKQIATRIDNVLDRLPKGTTLGNLVDMGTRKWTLKFPQFGNACAHHLANAINMVAKEMVIEPPPPYQVSTLPEEEFKPIKVDPIKKDLSEMVDQLNVPSNDMLKQLSEKFKVTEKKQDSVTVTVGLDQLSRGQLVAKVNHLQKQLLTINRENVEMRRALVELKEKLSNLAKM